MNLQQFIAKCKSKRYTLDWVEFESDLTTLMQAGQTEQAETRPHPTQSEYIAALLESFRLIEPTDSDTKANHRIVLEVFCAWLIGRTDKRPDKWDVNIFLSDGHYNNLQQPPQAKGVSREEAEKVIWSMREWQSSPSTRTDCATYQLLIDRNDVKILETYIYSNKDGNSVQLLKEKLNDMIDRLNQSQPVNEGWIKVEDQLPEDDEIVLTYHKRGQSLCEARHGGLWSSQINWIGDYDVSPVSHWRQIPSPPKPEKL